MPDTLLTTVETATLLILLAEAGPVPNAKLTNDHRCALTKGSREKLERLKLIEVERVSGRYVLTLSEKGWAHCRTLLAAGSTPPRVGAVGGALYAVLRRWDRFLTAQQLSLGEFVTASDAPAAADAPAGEQTPTGDRTQTERETPAGDETPAGNQTAPTGDRTPAGKQTSGEQEVEERVRAAYRMIAPCPGDLVSLADLRDLVSDLVPADIDGALRRLHRQRGVTLVPEANQKTLDARTRAAAVIIGDQPKHSIAMGAS